MKDITIESSLKSLQPLSSGKAGKSDGAKGSFGKVLKGSIKEINRLQSEADTSIEQLIAGSTKNLHEAMIALEKADISFRLMMAVRNKIIEAYHEIMRMQV
jgi:flagellar hook-basal body complex protein FliE